MSCWIERGDMSSEWRECGMLRSQSRCMSGMRSPVTSKADAERSSCLPVGAKAEDSLMQGQGHRKKGSYTWLPLPIILSIYFIWVSFATRLAPRGGAAVVTRTQDPRTNLILGDLERLERKWREAEERPRGDATAAADVNEWAGWDTNQEPPQVLTGFQGFRPRFSPAPGLNTSIPVKEVHIAVVTSHFFGNAYNTFEPDCWYRGHQPLVCHFSDEGDIDRRTADGLWFHAPSMSSAWNFPEKVFPEQAFIVMSMESAAYYQHENDPNFMKRFDITSLYRLDNSIPYLYIPFDIRASDEAAMPKFDDRKPAVAYINSNCGPQSRRAHIMQELLAKYHVPVDAMGACLHNTDEPNGHGSDKVGTFKQYRVCVGMENSNAPDYVSEKLWHALEAGCVPLYTGAPNIRKDFLPSDDSAIIVEDYPSVAELAAEINRTLTDRSRFEHYTRWRSMPFEQLNEGYRTILRINDLPHPRCQICQLLADRKLQRLSREQAAGDTRRPAKRGKP